MDVLFLSFITYSYLSVLGMNIKSHAESILRCVLLPILLDLNAIAYLSI